MQSRLPDVNTAFIKRRNGVEEGIVSKNWDKVFGNLNAWNALLPRSLDDDGMPKYRVRISDIVYNKLTEVKSEAQCNQCEVYTDYNKVKVFDLIVPLIESVLTGIKTNMVWICYKCKGVNKIVDTIIAETILQEPYWLGVVARPPRRKDGLQDRGAYDRKMTQWSYIFISELEEKSTQFREDYKSNKEEFEEWDEDEVDVE